MLCKICGNTHVQDDAWFNGLCSDGASADPYVHDQVQQSSDSGSGVDLFAECKHDEGCLCEYTQEGQESPGGDEDHPAEEEKEEDKKEDEAKEEDVENSEEGADDDDS